MELLANIKGFLIKHKNDSIKYRRKKHYFLNMEEISDKMNTKKLDSKNIKLKKINFIKTCESCQKENNKFVSPASFIINNICLCWKHSYLLLNN